VLAVLVTGGALAGAQSPPADDRPHLLLVPHTPEGRAALERGDARVIARYEEFTLVEAAGGDDVRLRRAGADRRDDMREVSLPAAELDPKSERASLAAKEARDRDEALAVVQFIGPVKESWLERLEATGARVVQYAAQNAYVVHARGDALARVERLVGTDTAVRAVTPVRTRDKVEDALTRGDTRPVAVQTIAGAAGADARRRALAAGRRVRTESRVGELRTQFLELDGAEAATLAADPAVVAIVPYGEPLLLDERAAQIVAGNLTSGAPSGPGYLGWLSGKGFPSTTFDFTIDVTDEGLDNGSAPWHSDFYEDGTGSGASRVDYATDYTSDPTARDCGGHGTNVASIAAGYGTTGSGREDGAGFKHGIGVAPRALIGASKIFNCAGQFDYFGSFTDMVSDAYAAGARISNNSWGFSDRGSYSIDSQEYDALVRDAQPGVLGNQEMVEVFAAGNDGEGTGQGYASVGSPATAKNVIAVGASESVRAIGGEDGCGASDAEADNAGDIIDFSSRGPTDDLRLKPDLVAPGTHVVGAAPQHPGYDGNGVCNPLFPVGNALYSLVSGSSQASPEVAGAAALIRSWYSRPSVGGAAPSPALTKAILANTATDLKDGDNGKGAAIEGAPNSDQGWGRVDMGEVLDSAIAREYYDQSTTLGTSGDSFHRAYQAADGGIPLKVTLAWTDAPGAVDSNAYVNDLDLVVETGGHVYRGNVLADGQSVPGGSADPRNNLESVILPVDTNERSAVKVLGTNIAGDGVPGNGDSTDQDFALVVSNATEQASPVLAHDATTLDDSPAAGGDGDGALEPGESFEFDERLRNAGNAGATGVRGTLTSSDVAITAPGTSDWPNLGVGATATNDPTFDGALAAAATCGADVTATLALTTDQGGPAHTVPLTLATGVEGAPVARTDGDPPLAIPDDSAAGVTSTIVLPPTAGLIKDLDVRITDLDHTWVGDMSIDITAPDGTTVKLAEHPGGPDNNNAGANAFVNTIFDDQAPTSLSAGSAPYTGRFRPQNDQLARFQGKDAQGTWTLRVRDLFEGDTGSLVAWGTDMRPAICALDSTVPQTTIDAGPDQGDTVASPDPTFRFSSNPGGASFECELDGGGFTTCTSPNSYTGLSDGTHTFRVRAISGSGGVDPTPAARTWTIDTKPPNTSIGSGPSGRVGSDAASFQFVSPDTSGAAFECRLDSEPFSVCTEPKIYSGLANGQHSFQVRAWDSAGNVDASPATRTWTVDTTPPTPSVTSPLEGEGTNDITPTISGSAGTAAGDSSTVTVKVYEGPAASGTPVRRLTTTRDSGGAWSLTVTPALSVGAYTIQAEQADDASPSNLGAGPEVTFDIVPDPVPPDTTIASGPSGPTTSRDAAFTFGSTESGSDFECSVDGTAFAACGSPYTLLGLSEGQHTFSVQARDPAGNLDPSAATHTWTVDLTPPALAVTAPAGGQWVTDVTPGLAGTAGSAAGDDGAVTVKLWPGTLAAGLPAQTLVVPRDASSGAWSAAAAALADGTWTVRAEQADAAGNVGTSAPVAFGVDTTAPDFALVPAEEHKADALAGRLTVLAGCASACRVSARLTVPATIARRIGVSRARGAAAISLGSASTRLSAQGTRRLRLPLSRRARRSIRGVSSMEATLRVDLSASGRSLTVRRRIALMRATGLGRVARKGLRLAGACSEACILRGRLLLGARAARRIGLAAPGGAPVTVADGTARAAPAGSRLIVRVPRSARKALLRARRLESTFELLVSGVTGPELRASRPLPLRR
jgi:subtilisin-like proprotein convertase family protein